MTSKLYFEKPLRDANKRSWIAISIATVFVLGILLGVLRFEFLFPIWLYRLSTVLLFMLGSSLLFVRHIRSGLVLLCLALSDFYVLSFRFDTMGADSLLHLAHQNWLRRYVKPNRDGFWEDKISTSFDAPNIRTIMAVGDSFTWGQGLRGSEKRFTDLLERDLKQLTSGRVRILNFGVSGADTLMETQTIAKHGPSLRPDTVMVFYLCDDFAPPLGVMKTEVAELKNPWSLPLIISPTLNFVYWQTIGPWRFLEASYSYYFNRMYAYLDKDQFRIHMNELRTLVDTIRKLDSIPIIAILPFPHLWKNMERQWRDHIYEKIAHTLTSQGAQVIALQDLEEEFSPAEFQIYRWDPHPNERVHKAIAARLLAWFVWNQNYL